VVDEKASAYRRARVDFDPGQPARDVRDKPREPLELELPQAMRQPMEQERVKSRLARDHFPAAARGRIALENDRDFLLETPEHVLETEVVGARSIRCPSKSVNFYEATSCEL
jgi:hypothetical protein